MNSLTDILHHYSLHCFSLDATFLYFLHYLIFFYFMARIPPQRYHQGFHHYRFYFS